MSDDMAGKSSTSFALLVVFRRSFMAINLIISTAKQTENKKQTSATSISSVKEIHPLLFFSWTWAQPWRRFLGSLCQSPVWTNCECLKLQLIRFHPFFSSPIYFKSYSRKASRGATRLGGNTSISRHQLLLYILFHLLDPTPQGQHLKPLGLNTAAHGSPVLLVWPRRICPNVEGSSINSL